MTKIAKTDMKRFIARLLEQYTVYAPVQVEDIILFQEIGSPSEAYLDYQNSAKSPKGVFLPQSEVLFRYDKRSDQVKLTSPEEIAKERVLLGVRGCDVRALSLLDTVFDTADNPDVYYTEKRGKTIIIGMACDEPSSLCFCTSVGGSPFDKRGSDIFLTDIGDAYLVDILTDRGEELLDDTLFQESTDADIAVAQRTEAAVLERMPPLLDLKRLRDKLDSMVDSPFWQSLAERCLGCGVCAYLCPSCYCFDIVDEDHGSWGERVRNWDACMFSLYSLETSGHNPRSTGSERWRQRLMHKFSYSIGQCGDVLCTGCGRCIQSCPVNIDIRKVITDVLAS